MYERDNSLPKVSRRNAHDPEAHAMSNGLNTRLAPEQQQDQAFATAGIKPMERPGFVTRILMAVVAWAERLNLRFSKFENTCIYDNSLFPWVTGSSESGERSG